MPAKDYYDPEGMSPGRKREFEEWYQNKVNERSIFDLRQELLEYCQSDVKLLRQGCVKFQQEFQALADFNPMEKCFTIASACNRFFRAKCILPHTLACEPVQGWIDASKPHSKVALEWLHWVEHTLPSSTFNRLQHAGNSGEVKIKIGTDLTHVDGYDPCTKTIYKFNGSFFHGCLTCF